MSTDPAIGDDEEYASSEDSDFAPDDAPAATSDSSDLEDDDAADTTSKRRRPAGDGNNAEADDYHNSGDEAIISKGRKRQKKAKAKGEELDLDEDGGEGGLIKTRRQRAAEKEERKYAAVAGPVTVDVDAIWAEMMTGDRTTTKPPELEEDKVMDGGAPDVSSEKPAIPASDESNMVQIKRTYNFAGRVHTEEKLVPRDSAEAKLYLAAQGEEAPADLSPPTKRLAKKAFRSAFEPVMEGMTGRSDLNLGLAARMKAAKEAQMKKLNTVEKSRMDWAGFVDKEGIKDELELAGKSKDSYTARQDFLARSEALRESEARQVRLAGRA